MTFNLSKLLVLTLLMSAFSGCHYGTPVPGTEARVRGLDIPYAPTSLDTAKALELFAKRAPEVFPLTETEAKNIIGEATITYTSTPIVIFGEPVEPDRIITGLTQMRVLVLVLVDSTRHDTSTNALIHELCHELLWVRFGDPSATHAQDPSGRWTTKTDVWIDSVMKELSQ